MEKRTVVPAELGSYSDDWRMSPGLVSGGLLFTGMTGHRSDGTFAVDPAEQIGDAFTKIDLVLDEAGLDRAAIVDVTSYHVGLQDHIEIFKEMRDQLVVEPYPAWTVIEVSGFATPGAIVDDRVVASTGR